MSCSYHATLVYGVPMSKVFEIKTFQNKITKYDPDTGKPYEKTAVEKKLYFFGKEMPTPEETAPPEWVREWADDHDVEGLDAFDMGEGFYSNDLEELDYDKFIVGVEMLHVRNEDQELVSLTQDQFDEVISKAEAAFEKCYNDDFKLESNDFRVWLVPYVSC